MATRHNFQPPTPLTISVWSPANFTIWLPFLENSEFCLKKSCLLRAYRDLINRNNMFRQIVTSVLQKNLLGRTICAFTPQNRLGNEMSKNFHFARFGTSALAMANRDRESKYSSSVKQAEGVDAETPSASVQLKLEGMFASSGIPCPTLETHRMVIDGVRYDELPVVSIKATRNNTHIALTNYKGVVLTLNSCGCEGFKNAKKGTNIAAQATGMTIGQRAKNMDIKYVRVAVKGLGPGRLAAIKGLQLAGLEVVSISDTTVVLFGGPRPRKRRRL